MSTAKKYMSLQRLQEYDALIKQEIDSKAPISHNHDDRYYTETEIDNKISAVNASIGNITSGSTVVKEAEHATNSGYATNSGHATSADSATTAVTATSATKDSAGNTISTYYETKTDATAKLNTAKSYTDTEVAKKANVSHTHAISDVTNLQTALDGKSSTSHKHDSDYDAKGAAENALASAKTYADNAANTVKNDLLNGAGTAYDTLKELGDLIDDNKEAIDALEEIASGKANATHSHAISDVSGLQTALDGKAASSHGTHVTYSTTAPVMDGTASVGTATTVARSDHKHPTDTSRASKTEFDTHVADTTKHITATERTNWGTAYTHSQAAHAPSNAEKNQNAFSKVAVSNQTTVEADTVTDTLTLVAGNNVTITTNATNDSITITAKDTVTTVDVELSSTSTNPVQNKVVNSAVATLTSAVNANTSTVSAHTTAISNIQTELDSYEEITSQEIIDLFGN